VRDEGGIPGVRVGPFEVSDLTSSDVVQELVRLVGPPSGHPARAFALHVGGLVARRDGGFVRAMNDAELVYADGASVVLIAKAAGARRISRSSTTDIGWDVLRGLTALRGEPPVVSIVGGRPGLAAEALDVLVQAGVARAGVTDHGYHDDWTETLRALRERPADVLVVGLGAPQEMLWVSQHHGELVAGLVLTCGGWLGFLVGAEARAPAWAQRLSLEWAFRLGQDPRRLASRYTRGAGATAILCLLALFRRRS
jgi:N-acetylglucosaminyldiphosphoundecaprenol N-acetyl-beta-D-mannosaminyltransferase